jgi:folate-binding protein YgfZ
MADASFEAQVAAGRTGAVYMDRPTWGRVRVTGRDRATFLHNLTTNDIKALTPGHGCSAVVINQRAQILDHVEVYALPDAFFVITGPGKAEGTLAWWDRYLITEDVELADETAETALVYLTGPGAAGLIETEVPAAQGLPLFGHAEGSLGGAVVRVMRTRGVHGEGYHIVSKASDLPVVHAALAGPGAVPIDDAAFEVLRAEWGYPLVGRELTENNNPWEARLDGSVSLNKGCYLGQEVVARLNTYNKVQRYLVGLELAGDRLPDAAPELLDAEGKAVGFLTTAVVPPGADRAIALGFVKGAYVAPGTALTLKWGDQTEPATVVDRPYWEGNTREAGAPSRS